MTYTLLQLCINYQVILSPPEILPMGVHGCVVSQFLYTNLYIYIYITVNVMLTNIIVIVRNTTYLVDH